MKMKKNLYLKKALSLLILLSWALWSPAAEQLYSPEWDYALDLPEGYVLTARDGSSRYNFEHQMFPVNLQIALYELKQFPDGEKALSHVTDQLASTGPKVSFLWRNRQAAISKVESASIGGWSVALELDGKKGWLVMACTTTPDKTVALEPLIISTLDTVYTDDGSWFETGPMTAFAWAPEQEKMIDINFAGKPHSVPLNNVDAAANQSVIDREFSLLTGYLETEYVFPAWKRYYRLIYRDAWTRIEKASFMLGSLVPPAPEKAAAELLAWTQGFTYERDRDGADFLNLPDAIVSRRGDCDSRALLLVLILNQMGVDAVLLVSPEYSHALAAVDCPGEGARYAVGEKKYLIADTTAKVGLGKIAEDMSDSSKWFAVGFPAFPQP